MITTILTDIEGTTSSIDFVKDTLFPYARERLPAFVALHADEPDVQHWLHEAAKEAGLVSIEQHELIELLLRWIDEDRKSTALKALQGMIWADGYRGSEFRAHVYPDAVAQLRRWSDAGKRIAVYSSGSVQAQTLFFAHTDAGDLSPIFSAHFDTTIGAKREAQSYRRIADELGVAPAEVLFLSDVVAELDAARDAGMATTLIARGPEGCAGANAGAHRCATDFDGVEAG